MIPIDPDSERKRYGDTSTVIHTAAENFDMWFIVSEIRVRRSSNKRSVPWMILILESSKWDIQREKLVRYAGIGIFDLFGMELIKNKQKERKVKKMHKMKGKKGYAILALVIAISFITVLTWHDLVQASYKTKENVGSTSFPNNDKYTYKEVKGPSGTSTLNYR